MNKEQSEKRMETSEQNEELNNEKKNEQKADINNENLKDKKLTKSDTEVMNDEIAPIKSQTSTYRNIYNRHADTHSRIFGNYHPDDMSTVRKSATEGNSNKTIISSEKEERTSYVKKPDGNPLTGEGYEQQITQRVKVKVPPGGFSSGLW